ncbi:hypothetical protein E2493_02980 [Sphingomonas parva]|uniref:Flagellar protein FlgN n=1 Tax=Sphingomonas parva TaxID=2555898 RepID=A0A4Y8ZV78_9SPHN|nr:hypothetical protein [Sphingomonas parva]TFI59814.1 hypothetical protein E2493_02980 [Sphingomonas parva]
MLKNRLRAAELVAQDFLKLENAADEAATLAATCMTTMLQQRAEANLPVATGVEALQLIADAAQDLVKARQRIVEAHGALVSVRSGIGLRAYRDESECPDMAGSAMNPTRLAVVA